MAAPVIAQVDSIDTKFRSFDTVFHALNPFQSDRQVRMLSQPLDVLPVQLRVDEASNRSTYSAAL